MLKTLPFCLGLAAGLEEGFQSCPIALGCGLETSATTQCLFPNLFKGPGSLKSFSTGSQVSYSCIAGQLLGMTLCSLTRLS